MKGHENDDDLAKKLAALPRTIEPAHDLWGGVASRLERTSTTRVVETKRENTRKRTVLAWPMVTATSALLAAAAVLLVLRAPPSRAPNNSVAAPLASLETTPVRLPPATELAGVAVVPEENTFDTALAALTPTFDERVRSLPRHDAESIGKSLATIRAGIDATRAALAEDPDDADLREQLDDEYEQELQTMNDVLDWTTRS